MARMDGPSGTPEVRAGTEHLLKQLINSAALRVQKWSGRTVAATIIAAFTAVVALSVVAGAASTRADRSGWVQVPAVVDGDISRFSDSSAAVQATVTVTGGGFAGRSVHGHLVDAQAQPGDALQVWANPATGHLFRPAVHDRTPTLGR